MQPCRPETLVDLLRWRAQITPDRIAYTHLVDGESTERSLTYGQLDTKARSIAARLASFAGERVLVLHPYGLDYITAFFGCLYAGAIAVTAFPPRTARHLKRLQILAQGSGALAAAASTRIHETYGSRLGELVGPVGEVVATDALDEGSPRDWSPPSPSPGELACIQYSSGSTTDPKGVMLSHACLRANCGALAEACGLDESSRGVFWVPLYHDMGLIFSVVAPVSIGFPAVLMSPLSFIKRPLRWLRAISRYRATFSAAPNFAFELCAREITPEQCRDLDLSYWRVALNGAEPVRGETLERFARLVGPAGFPQDAHRPAYGLAEATVLVTAVRAGRRPETLMATPRQESMKRYVSCGEVTRHHRVVVVDPHSCVPLGPGDIGEVWVAGPSVALGYWGKDEETQAVFGARTAGGEGPFLRTGDLGFLEGGELFITGRRKDLIIVRGANLFPQDIEWTVEDAHPAIRPTCGAAFGMEVDGEEQLGIVYEADPGTNGDEKALGEIIQRIRRLVTEDHEVTPYVVALVRHGCVPKTSSGKIQRFACREAFLAGSLQVVAESRLDADDGQGEKAERSEAGSDDTAGILAYLQRIVASRLAVAIEEVHPDANVSELGLDSLRTTELCNHLESRFGVDLPMSLVLQTGLGELAAKIARHQGQHETEGKPPLRALERSGKVALSFAQARLWFLDQLVPDNAFYSVPAAWALVGPLDIEALRGALEAIVARHETLRTTVQAVGGHPHQVIAASLPPELALRDLSELGKAEAEAEAARLVTEEAARPFDLARGPLVRAGLIRLGSERHVLWICLHHIVSDGWSMGVLFQELGALYGAFSRGEPSPLSPLEIHYADYAAWQRSWLQGEALEAQLDWWRSRLAGAPPRPGAAHRFPPAPDAHPPGRRRLL